MKEIRSIKLKKNNNKDITIIETKKN